MKERKKEKKENSTELQKPNVEAEVYNNKKSDWEKNRKRKSSVSFHSADKINNHNRGGEKEKKKKKREREREKIPKELQNKSKRKNNKCFSWVTAVRGLSLAGSHSPPHLPRMPLTLCWSLDLLWGQLRFKSGPSALCSCLQCPQLSELVHFVLWKLSMTLYRHRVCLVDCVDLICSLYSWWEGFGSSSLATLPLDFNCGFISTSSCGLFTGVCFWGCPGGFGFASVRARYEGGAES